MVRSRTGSLVEVTIADAVDSSECAVERSARVEESLD